MIRIGLVGFGGHGWTLGLGIQKLSEELDCRLVAAADSRLDDIAEQSEQLTGEGVEIFRDALEMFETYKGRCDAMYISTGIHSHMPLAVAAAGAGYHIHLEKPPAATVQEVDAMIRAVHEAKVMCLVGFQAVHGSDLRSVKERIVSGRLGKVKKLVCSAGWPRGDSYYARNDWAGKLRSGQSWVLDGPANNALAHQINNMLFWASGESEGYATPAVVRAELYAAGPVESHNTAAIEIRTIEGPTAYFLGSHCSRKNFGPTITIDAELGRVHWTDGIGAKITYADGTEENCPHDPKHRDKMTGNLLQAIRANDPAMLLCDLEDARNMTLAIDGAHESSGKIHRIDSAFVHRINVNDESESKRTVVEGLDELLVAAAENGCLFSDLDSAPSWAVSTKKYDLSGYDNFPKNFRCS